MNMISGEFTKNNSQVVGQLEVATWPFAPNELGTAVAPNGIHPMGTSDNFGSGGAIASWKKNDGVRQGGWDDIIPYIYEMANNPIIFETTNQWLLSTINHD